ncbi:hypothetical protein G7Z17_g8763 [Cylindrodendrum hubeiense]|uniref:C2H2-type domain-containing protein n=1 Tax=Cylindrodendrum hubeiense TaxID=595255 RepID=A0A9P5LED2_9HYPO|nr:hypothetical protein G7Z17_g8763 [Cylindrodendrum hubeiense]
MELLSRSHLDKRPKSSHLGLQSIARYEFASDSIATDDSLGGEPSTRSQSPSETQPNASNTAVTPRGGSRIAVILGASPSHQLTYGIGTKNEHSEESVISDLKPRGKQRAMLATQTQAIPKPAYSPTRQVDATPGLTPAGPMQNRGRPKGWRPGMPYGKHGSKKQLATAAGSRESRLIKTRPSLNGFPKRRGRPPKAPSPQPREIYCKLNTPFIAFLCEWHGCKAELHNLDTLRRHVYVVHGGKSGRSCLWGKCGRKKPPPAFDHPEGFKTHMEEAHLVPFAWHVGDGPNNSSGLKAEEKMDVEDEIPDYLKDRDGKQVTPSVKNQQLEDFVTWKNNRRRLRELLIRRDENQREEGPSTAASEELVS